MRISFSKYQGTGNDFVIIDNRENTFPAADNKLIEKLCNRRFGIGADGLILIQEHDEEDFEMIYFNSDGFVGSMCGNGGRCAVHFAHKIGVFENLAFFHAYDGKHLATIMDDVVNLGMADVKTIEEKDDFYLLDTGSPHLVSFVNDLDSFDVYHEGQKLRYDKDISEKGVNVNFIEMINDSSFKIRTYERGVENETLSCGTGSIAAALAFNENLLEPKDTACYQIHAPGGKLEVCFKKEKGIYKDVFLKGAVGFVFEGSIEI